VSVVRKWTSVSLALACLVLLRPNQSTAQTDPGRIIYSKFADSVLLVFVADDKGQPVALGSAFLVEGGRIITNAHVVRAGKPFLQFGPAKVPATIEKIDADSDLAILRTEVQITASPIPMAETLPQPGDVVYALGNPEGLEKSISQGVVSARREFAGHQILQISSAISPGSSGGPVLNSSGELVGIAVAILKEGQNLNFAIPVSTLRELIDPSQKQSRIAGFQTIDDIIVRVMGIEQQEGPWSNDADSHFWQSKREMKAILEEAVKKYADDPAALLKIADAENIETAHPGSYFSLLDDYDLSVQVLRKVVALRPTPQNQMKLANMIYERARSLSSRQDPSISSLLAEAERMTRSSIDNLHPPPESAYVLLGDILVEREQFSEATKYYNVVLEKNRAGPNSYMESRMLRGLIECADGLNNYKEAERLFSVLQSKQKELWGLDWSRQGDRLHKQKQYKEAGLAYETGAQIRADNPHEDRDAQGLGWCKAADSYYLADQDDSVLEAGRQCIQFPIQHQVTAETVGDIHTDIAMILDKRGVYSEALAHAKQAIELNATDAWAFYASALALKGMRQFTDAVEPAKEAIKAADGKYAEMHFALGDAYFGLQQWSLAEQSYEMAAKLDPKDAAAAYNIALCLQNLGYRSDAASWFKEVLRRNPQHKDKDQILRRIKDLQEPIR
jgi:tetratricopeptide (TPR) repeat protein